MYVKMFYRYVTKTLICNMIELTLTLLFCQLWGLSNEVFADEDCLEEYNGCFIDEPLAGKEESFKEDNMHIMAFFFGGRTKTESLLLLSDSPPCPSNKEGLVENDVTEELIFPDVVYGEGIQDIFGELFRG